MWRAFNLELSADYKGWKALGQAWKAQQDEIIQKELREFVNEDGSLDGNKIQNAWFPQVEADVFISHSHADEELAISLAGLLAHGFKLKPFIDSTVWGYVLNLLERIDKKYCVIPKDANQPQDAPPVFDYNKRNGSTSHVHAMLSTALGTMMDRTECVLFLNTKNSIISRLVKKACF